MSARMSDTGIEVSQEKNLPWWKRPTIIANIVFLVVFLGVAIHYGRVTKFAHIFSHLDYEWITLAIVLQVGTYFLFGGLLLITLRFFDKKGVKLHTVAELSVAKLFIDQLIPTLGVGGSYLILRALMRREVQRGEAMAALVTEFASHWIADYILFVIAFAILWVRTDITPVIKFVSIVFSGIFILVLPGIVYAILAARRNHLPAWLLKFKHVQSFARTLAEVPNEALKSFTLWFWSAVLQGGIILFDIMTLWACLHALGSTAPFEAAFITFMIAAAVGTISIIPGGLLFFEGAAIAILLSFGISFETGITALALMRIFTYWLPMIPGFFFFHKEVRQQEREYVNGAAS